VNTVELLAFKFSSFAKDSGWSLFARGLYVGGKKKKTHDKSLEWQVITEALYNTDGNPNFVPLKYTLRSLPTFLQLTLTSFPYYVSMYSYFLDHNGMNIHEIKINAESFTRLHSVNEF
jgi:hypothetical protein